MVSSRLEGRSPLVDTPVLVGLGLALHPGGDSGKTQGAWAAAVKSPEGLRLLGVAAVDG